MSTTTTPTAPRTDHDTFIRSICERPNDIALRLIFADWLEERGDPRGEFP